jgi:hypothetical protein
VIISFAWTTPALLAGAKTMTRRDWKAEHASRIRVGQIVDAWDRSPRTGKGRKVATIRVAAQPLYQWSNTVDQGDWKAEGFDWLLQHGSPRDRERVMEIWNDWRVFPVRLWVVRFELVDVVQVAA